MSMFQTVTMPCPSCDAENTFDAFASVNADRRPDLREQVLTGTFQRVKCASCAVEFRLEPNLNYLDMARGLWLRACPIDDKAYWDTAEADARAVFDEAYGDTAPRSAREIGAELTMRVTFGWGAFREKLLAQDLNIDDLSLEKMKISILRNRPGNPIAPSIELRLIAAQGDELHFAWQDAQTGELEQMFTAPQALYDDIHNDPDWKVLGDKLSAGPFIDMQRLFLVPLDAES